MSQKLEVAGNILAIPLNLIDADPAWNIRSPWEKGGDREHSQEELNASIKEKGQEDPCDVVKVGSRYRLIVGFRRHAAVTANEIKTLLCRVKGEMTEAQARLRNATENMERDDLRAADVVWGVKEYLTALGGERPSQEKLAATFARSQSYISKYLKIIDNVLPEVIQAWREGRPVGATDGPRQDVGILKFMQVAQVEKERQAEQWASLLGIGPDGKKKEKDPAEKAMAEAKKVGALLGRLVYAEVIEVSGHFTNDLALFVPTASGLPKSQVEAVAGALSLAFMNSKTGENKKENGESEEE